MVAMTREEGLKDNTTSTGRQLGVVAIPQSTMYRITYVDEKPGKLPEKIRDNKYTSIRYAQFDIDAFVSETWDVAAENTKTRKAS